MQKLMMTVMAAVAAFATRAGTYSLTINETWDDAKIAEMAAAYDGVEIGSGSTLTLANGSAITFALPISGGGNLFKDGVGTLTLGSPGNAIGVLDVSAGALRLGAAQTVGSVAFAEGATLEIAEGLAAAGVWTTVLTLPKDADATVLPDLGQNYRVRLVETDTAIQLQAKPVSGTILLLR